MFAAQSTALEAARHVAPLVKRLATHDRSLADQVRRASASIVLNLAEGNHRAGKDRLHLFRIADGSRGEVIAALQLAIVFEQLTPEAAAAALATLDRLGGLIYGLLRARVSPQSNPRR
jgi:four helix bundle protein